MAESANGVGSLLSSLADALEASASSLPEAAALATPDEGISLLATKNELLLSYLQNLVFLILLKLRNSRDRNGGEGLSELGIEATKKLAGLRVYLEKGVRPLEGKLQYQLDKLLHAANEADAAATMKGTTTKKSAAKTNGKARNRHTRSGSDSGSASVSTGSSRSASPAPAAAAVISDLSHRPNLAAFARPRSNNTKQEASSTNNSTAKNASTAPYRPPRINPTSLPTTNASGSESRSNGLRNDRKHKSHLLDDFVREELTDAPLAQPSIGAGTGLKGRERAEEEERREYEETRLVRLPENFGREGKGKAGKGRKRGRAGVEFGDDGRADLAEGWGGVGGVDFRGAGARKVKKIRGDDGGAGGRPMRIGEQWERRVKKGIGKNKRR